MIICDAAKWDPATACHGVDAPWASTTYVDYVAAVAPAAAVPGTVRAWHFLAEKNADVAKNFQIEKDNKINWIV
jgi:F420-dependent methylenetetrahydromethanopterin dehydrogenase